MTQLFIRLYNYFQQHRFLFYLSLGLSLLVMGFFASQVRFEENVTRFFPDTKDARNAAKVFDNLKIKDKIIVMLSPADSTAVVDRGALVDACKTLKERLTEQVGGRLIKEIFSQVDANQIEGATNFVYNNLPLFLTEADYQRFDSLLTIEGIEAAMQKSYTTLLSPTGIALRSYILKDPLGIGTPSLKHLQEFQLEANYEISDEHIFSKEGSTLLMFITPVFGTGSTGKNDELISVIEKELQRLATEQPTIQVEYFGGPSVGVYNARQIKKDTILTSTVALLIIIAFISLVFKRKRSILLIIAPALFGGLFALCLIYFIKGDISAIAVGAGSAVMGIALSYSIHMLAHQNHVSTVQQLIKELAYPLTVGSFTTIGAFFGLTFTSSDLLRDFGLFASLALIGTTLFCLVWLPHFLQGEAGVKQGAVLRFIEKINAYSFEKNRWLIGSIALVTLIGLFTSQRVKFNDDMMSLNYEPKHLKQSEEKLMKLFEDEDKTVLFVSVGKDLESAIQSYTETNNHLSALQQQGTVKSYASARRFLLPQAEQHKRVQRWNDYWTTEKRTFANNNIQKEAAKHRFKAGAFDGFYQWFDPRFELQSNPLESDKATQRLLSEWHSSADSITMLITQVRLSDTAKEGVYKEFETNNEVVIFDRAYFANKWVSAVNDDFYLILYLSSFLIFFALLLSYGRIELTLMSFLPMLISWIIILGLMGVLGIEFNIINIILSTFIFGIGDDFSIFIMDGLQNRYRTGQKVLNSHKTAIFFAAFTTVVGMGALIFAKHPALQSISLVSILGIVTVVLVAYTIQPIIYAFIIGRPTAKGLPPYTLIGLLRTTSLFLLFLFGCLLLRILIAVLYFVPLNKARKKQFICRLIQLTCKAILFIATFVRKEYVGFTKETFKQPVIVVANHQSFIDILVLLSLTPKMVMVTNRWVWNSPFFGAIIRYADYYYIGDGYEQVVVRMQAKVEEGYSIAIFPEGTRTYNGAMKRFHKGAFYLAEALQLDILPIVLYGTGKIIAKAQPFNIRKGILHTECFPLEKSSVQPLAKESYQERTKRISALMKKQYARICNEKDTPDNPALYEALIQNYIYKGPIEEWYLRIKVKMEKNYAPFHQLVPMKGQITDIGCGYGPLCYMLSMLSSEREVLGIDYDEDKIAVAQHGWLRNERIRFEHADALSCTLPESDVFILNDMLHYLSSERQHKLLTRCAARLRPQGVIILRDGNTSDARRHRLTRFTEWLSTRVVCFNKTAEALCFTSSTQIAQIAHTCGMEVEAIRNDKYTSNTIYVFKKK